MLPFPKTNEVPGNAGRRGKQGDRRWGVGRKVGDGGGGGEYCLTHLEVDGDRKLGVHVSKGY